MSVHFEGIPFHGELEPITMCCISMSHKRLSSGPSIVLDRQVRPAVPAPWPPVTAAPPTHVGTLNRSVCVIPDSRLLNIESASTTSAHDFGLRP